MQFLKFVLDAAYMGHGFATLIPFSIISIPRVDQSPFKSLAKFVYGIVDKEVAFYRAV